MKRTARKSIKRPSRIPPDWPNDDDGSAQDYLYERRDDGRDVIEPKEPRCVEDAE